MLPSIDGREPNHSTPMMLATTRNMASAVRHGARAHARPWRPKATLHGAPIARRHRLLVGERLHGAHRGQVLGSVGRSFGQRILRACATGGAPTRPKAMSGNTIERDGEQHQQRQVRARHEHHDERAEQHDEAAQRLRQRRSGDGLDLRRVGGEAAHQLAGMGALEECGAEVGDVAEDVAAQVGDDALAQPVDVVEARRAGDGQHQADDDQHAK